MDYAAYLRAQIATAETAFGEAREEAARANALASRLKADLDGFRRKLAEELGESQLPLVTGNGSGGETQTERVKRVLREHREEGIGRKALLEDVNKGGAPMNPKYLDAVLSRFRQQKILRTENGRNFLIEEG
jgi:hypothetical protein